MTPHEIQPTFSVIVPTYNRPRPLAACLAALARMDYPRDRYEIIIVDDGSTASIRPITDRFRPVLDVKLLEQTNAGPAAARNAGAAAAGGQYLAFTDDDCLPRPDWLTRLAAALMCDPDTLVGGRCINALPGNPYASASQIIIDVVNEHFNRDHQQAVMFPSDNMACARRRFLEIGGFDASFRCSEDRDLCDRWAQRGRRLIFCPDAVIDHAHVMGLPGFWRQHFSYGRGAWRFHRARARRGTGQLEVEGSFYLKCFRQALRTQPPRRAISLAALLGVWQLANTAGFFCEALRRGCKDLRRRNCRPLPLDGGALSGFEKIL